MAEAKLKALRGQCKGAITRIYNAAPSALAEGMDHSLILVHKERLLHAFEQYENLCAEIYDDEDPTEVESKYMFSLAMLNEAISKKVPLPTQDAKTRTLPTPNKLPSIQIPHFDGKFADFKPFMALFMSIIDKDASLSGVQKLYYLKTFLKGQALELIQNLPLTDEHYLEALSLLNDRYDNSYKTIAYHVNCLLDLLCVNKCTSTSLRNFVSIVKLNLAALKSLDQDVDKWDMILMQVLTKKLDNNTVTEFEMQRDHKTLPTISDLIGFIERRATALENVAIKEDPKQQTTKTMVSTCCLLCKCPHKLYTCQKFKLMSLSERLQFVDSAGLCHLCLNVHTGKCHFKFRCSYCKKEHNALLHKPSEVPFVHSNVNKKTTMVSNTNTTVLLPTVRVNIAKSDGTFLTARALLDSGSQMSFVTKELAETLQCSTFCEPTNVVGISNKETSLKTAAILKLHSRFYPFDVSVNCHLIDTISAPLPQTKIDLAKIKLPGNIKLADELFSDPGNIQILIGADIFFQLLLAKPERLSEGGPFITQTLFGDVISGNILTTSGSGPPVSMFCQTCDSNLDTTLAKFWETEKVPQIYNETKAEKQLCEQIFQDTVQLQNNQFTVSLPLKVPLQEVSDSLGDSFSVALQRFINLDKKFQRERELLEQYKAFIDEFVKLDQAEYIKFEKYDLVKDPVYFIPHHAVMNSKSKTTPLRVVFDGSMRTKDKKVSLNDTLLNGPTVQSELFDILLLFRLNKFVLIADIQKMFRCVNLDESYRGLQTILWRENPNENIKCLQLKTVTYGLKSSPFLATRCLIELADRFGDKYPLAAFALRHNTYVDDIVACEDNLDTLNKLKQELIELLALGSFRLHKWCSNNRALLSDIPNELQHFDEIDLDSDNLILKTLGLVYDVTKDVFKITVPDVPTKKTAYTKREITSFVSRIFDPLGIIGPITVSCKLMLQKLWIAGLAWDDPISPELSVEWEELVSGLQSIDAVELPRHVSVCDARAIQLIGFCDGSNAAYGCCIYLRVIGLDNNVSMMLLCSKSRVNPAKKELTTPRVELNAALLLALLISRVYDSLCLKLDIEQDNVILFSDSQIVLAWLQTEPIRLSSYVGNRVKKIADLTKEFRWLYINTGCNPADLISRGMQPQSLIDSALWRHGPDYLLNSTHEFTNNGDSALPAGGSLPELKPLGNKALQCMVVLTANNFFQCFNLEKYSSILKMQRVLAYCLRFIKTLKHKQRCQSEHLTCTELKNALHLIVKNEQARHFASDLKCLQINNCLSKNSTLRSLNPFMDKDGFIRVGGRIQNAILPFFQKHPVILPKHSVITDLIIEHEHKCLLHGGNKLVLASLHKRFWLVNGNREVKRVLHKCIVCFKLKAQAAEQLMGSLPYDRVNQARPFQKVGMDYAGPFLIKQSRIRSVVTTKGYVLIFVCFVTKCIHIELVSDMTTECFMAAFKRFISRRNLPSDIYCDNAATFKGAKNQLEELYLLQSSPAHQAIVNDYCSNLGVKFHMIPSYSPVFGGLWESGVKSIKYHLKRVVGSTVLTYEEFYTVLVQIESILNSRPITQITNDVNDLSYLTPAHFLVGAPFYTYPDSDVTNIPTNRLSFWNLCKQISQSFWKVWKSHYLNLLQNRPKWKDSLPNVKEGDLVLLKSEDTSPLSWPLARIVRVIPGKDGKVRVVEVKTNRGTYLRSITKVCILPIES